MQEVTEEKVGHICHELIGLLQNSFNDRKPITEAEVEMYNSALVNIYKLEEQIISILRY